MLIQSGGALAKIKEPKSFRVSAPSRNTKSMRERHDGITRAISECRGTGGIWAFIALGPLGGFALVWMGFIAAGCFFAAGGDIKALSKTIVGLIYGAIVAWIALLIIAKIPMPGRCGPLSSSE
jgi:hypothetical protein